MSMAPARRAAQEIWVVGWNREPPAVQTGKHLELVVVLDQKPQQHPRIAGRSRGSVLPDKKSRRPDDAKLDIWPYAASNEVWQCVENIQAPHGYVIVPRKPRVTPLEWYAGVKVAHVDTKLERRISANP